VGGDGRGGTDQTGSVREELTPQCLLGEGRGSRKKYQEGGGVTRKTGQGALEKLEKLWHGEARIPVERKQKEWGTLPVPRSSFYKGNDWGRTEKGSLQAWRVPVRSRASGRPEKVLQREG